MSRCVVGGTVLAMVALWVFGCGGGAPEIQLDSGEKMTLKHKVVQDLAYRGKNFVTVNVAGFARPITIEQEVSSSTDSVYADGACVVSFTFDKYSEVTYSGGQAIFNDDKEKMIVGENLWLRLKPDGNIDEWRGLEGVRSRDAQGWSLRESLVMAVAGSVPPMPVEPVGVGDTWTGTLSMPMEGPYGTVTYRITNTYELEGIAMKKGFRCARIAVTSDIMADGSGGDPSGGVEWKMLISGDGKGKVFFAIDEGYVVTSKEETDVDVETTTRRGREEPKTEYSSAKGESNIVLIQ